MQLARVVGTATATIRHPSLGGRKLLIVQPVAADGVSPDGNPLLAVDSLGAGRGERVMITTDGTSTRELLGSETTPARYAIIGICDA